MSAGCLPSVNEENDVLMKNCVDVASVTIGCFVTFFFVID